MDFKSLKKKREKGKTLKEMAEKVENMSGGGYKKDDRIYKPGFDKTQGKGNAIVRLLPAKSGDNFVRQFSHSFKGPGGFYWENSLTTVGEKDPVGISNSLYYNKGKDTGDDRLQKVASHRKRKTKYYMNVYVEKDDNNPDAVGKVMILECGPQIFNFVEQAIKPEFEDQEPLDPFDLWTGAPLKIRSVGNKIPHPKNPGEKILVPNYEKHTEFGNPCEFMDGDEEKMEEIFNQTYDLSEFVKVKTFDELAERFEKVTGEPYNALDMSDDERAEKEASKASDEFEKDQEEGNAPKSEDNEEQGTTDDFDHGEEEEENFDAPSKSSESDEDEDEDALLAEFQSLANKG